MAKFYGAFDKFVFMVKYIKILIMQAVACVGIEIQHNTSMPTNIPTKIVDAIGLGYTSGNRTEALKQGMPRLFTPWHSSLYPNLASPTGFEPVLAA